MEKNSFIQDKKKVTEQFRLICVFPEKTQDKDSVKSEVRNILHMELKNQLQQK